MGLYEVPLSMSLLGCGMGTMLANFHMCGIMLVVDYDLGRQPGRLCVCSPLELSAFSISLYV